MPSKSIIALFASFALIGANSGAAFAQEAPALPSAPPLSLSEVRSILVRAAAASPVVGEEVRDENGDIDEEFFLRIRVCTVRGCRVTIADKRSGAVIFRDGVWSPAYAPTGRGREVIRVKAFMAAERPGDAPDDKALETAARIKSVSRPQEEKD